MTSPALWRRAWAAPLWAHACALGVLLLVLMPVVGTYWQWSADEGAALSQAQLLAEGHGWRTPVPFPEVDPTGRWFPTHLSTRAADGSFLPYAKLPLYPLVLAGLLTVGGVTAVAMLGVFGTVMASWGAGRLAGRGGDALERPTLWALGLGTPLLFDSYQVMAHAIAAGFVGLAAVLVLTWWDRRSIPALVGCGLCAVLVVGLRNEGIFLALSAGTVLVVVAMRGRSVRRAAAGVVIGAAGVIAFGANRVAYQAIVGEGAGLGAPAAGDGGSLLRGRWDGFYQTFLETDGRPILLMSVVLLGVGAFALRSRPAPRLVVLTALGLSVVTTALAVGLHDLDVIPGLLVVCPTLVGGLLLVRRPDLRTTLGTAAAIGALFALAVLATQYRKGGSGEWGGRYFAIGLPLVLPLCIAALARAISPLDRELRRIVVGAFVASSLVVSVVSIATLRQLHQLTDRVITNVQATAEATEAGDGGPPVVISTLAAVPRLGWRQVPDGRWFLVLEDEELSEVVGRLADADVDQFTLATHPEYGVPQFGGWVVVEESDTSDGIPAIVYARSA